MSRSFRFAILVIVSLTVYFVGGYGAAIPHSARSVLKSTAPVLLLGFSHMCSRHEVLRRWLPAARALLVASCGFLVSWWIAPLLLGAMNIALDTAMGLAVAKCIDSVLVVGPVLAISWVVGVRPRDLYLRWGRVGIWLSVGLAAFAVFLALFLWQAATATVSRRLLLALAPWILVFVFANAVMEELHFRGLLLRPFEGLLGRHGANLCIATVFTAVHAPVDYAPSLPLFLAVVFTLAIVWGYLIQRTQALWGAVLFHAGADLVVVLGIYQSFGVAMPR